MPESSRRWMVDKFSLRMPPGFRDRIAAAAAANDRSMNAEFVARLQASFDDPELHLDALAEKVVARLERLLAEKNILPR